MKFASNLLRRKKPDQGSVEQPVADVASVDAASPLVPTDAGNETQSPPVEPAKDQPSPPQLVEEKNDALPEAAASGVLTVNLAAIVANWRKLAQFATPADCSAVVKADA